MKKKEKEKLLKTVEIRIEKVFDKSPIETLSKNIINELKMLLNTYDKFRKDKRKINNQKRSL